jgi:hypothetical protein
VFNRKGFALRTTGEEYTARLAATPALVATGERVSLGVPGCLTEREAYRTGRRSDMKGVWCKVKLLIFHFWQSSNSHGVT